MKKITIILLSLLFAFILVSCTDEPQTSTEKNEVKKEEVTKDPNLGENKALDPIVLPIEEPSAEEFSMEELARHGVEGDCRILIEGKVNDVSSFTPNHPGGPKILEGCGKDATSMFEGQGHSASAREILKGFYIGDIK